MSSILALDPGTRETGVVVLLDGRVSASSVLPNADVLQIIRDSDAEVLAIEMVASYGMPVGAEVFETCVWIGRFVQQWDVHVKRAQTLIYRKDVKLHLCGSARAKDGNIRQALLDRLGKPGTKKQKGPTYGVKSHAWAALAVAVTAFDRAA